MLGNRRRIFGVVLSVVSSFFAQAQKIDAALDKLAAGFQPEKIYIQYDKEYYVAGETIWFKAYFYNDSKPSSISNNFYLQFIDSKGNIVTTKKYPVFGAVAKGNIDIPDSLPQGNYYVRALTPDMLNYEEGFIYKKNIFVFHPTTAGASATAKTPQTVSLQFFPESGNMVDGILTVVGFKATDQWGTPVEVSGVIHSDDGTTIASFKSLHDGIGKVQFKPQGGKKYSAEVETAAGNRTFSFPEVKASGINIKVQDEKGGKKFQLSRSEKDKKAFDTLLVVADINNHVVYESEIAFEDYPSVIGHLVTDSLPSGILHLTVFDKSGLPLAERLSFVDNSEYRSGGDIAVTKLNSAKRGENIFELSFPDAIQRSCSVAIVDLPGTGFGDNENIYSRFLLTSDLKGYVFNPGWYFENRTDTTKLALDNLMLTHGWTRYNWNKILANTFPEKKYKDKDLISLTGRVFDDKDKNILADGKLSIYAEAEDSTGQNLVAAVSSTGVFTLDSVAFTGKTKLFYAYTDKKGKNVPAKVHIDENIMEQNVQVIPAGITEGLIAKNVSVVQNKNEIDSRYRNAQGRLGEVKELEKVVLQSKSDKKPIDIVNEKYTNGVFRDPGKVNIDLINEPANDKSGNVVDYAKNRIQQLEIQNGIFVNRKTISLMSGKKWTVGLFIDETPTDMNQLRILRMDQVALIKFFESGFVGVGSGSPGGALAVYTKDRTAVESKPDKLEYVTYNGYSITKEFYNPDYSKPEPKHSLADNRTTLYWNPNIYTDTETKSVRLNFYNNDFSKKFKVIAEGFDASGKLIHIEKIVE